MSEQTPEGAKGRLDALVGRVEALMRDSQLGGDHRRVTARKVCGLFYDEIERSAQPLEAHVGPLKCADCGLLYADFPLDVVLPDEQWAAITGRADGGGILCAGCITARGARLPGVTVARMQLDGG